MIDTMGGNNAPKKIGCDIASVSRIAVFIADKKFLNKVYTEYEQHRPRQACG